MKKNQINLLLVALVVLNILDGDFASPSVLGIVKIALIAVCLYLNNRKERS